MTLENLNTEIKLALVSRNTRLKNLYKNVKTKALAIAKDEKSEVTEDVCMQALKSELKQLEQTLASVPEDSALAAESKLNIAILQFWLPKQLTDEELEQRIKGIVMVMPEGTPFGFMMKECMKELKDVADGKRISKILKEL